MDDMPRGMRRASLAPRDSGKLSPGCALRTLRHVIRRRPIASRVWDAIGASRPGLHRLLSRTLYTERTTFMTLFLHTPTSGIAIKTYDERRNLPAQRALAHSPPLLP
ncbi:hypothetical protein NDU88_002534 [Pleurodeles waltl]|uniref:Uncharacterized protein n=1 Tax=Pleurodeles waltl TaxID=8319 RepID=A0AAV7MMZ3_PLEWA|nr:hypothetical protein NDU88_002534 [Pleurodeles waltl]